MKKNFVSKGDAETISAEAAFAIKNRLTITPALPPPTAALLGETRLLTAAQSSYTLGGIYQCQETSTGIYTWVLISSANVDLSDYETSWTGSKADWAAKTEAERAKYEIVNFDDDISSASLVFGQVASGDHNVVDGDAVYQSVDAANQNAENRLLVADMMEAAGETLLDATRLYIGGGNAFVKGGIYQCQEVSAGTYEWVLISTADVDLSLYKKIFTGTQATWNTLTDAQKKEYDIANITDDESESESIKDITNLLVKEGGYVSGEVYVKKLGHVVQLDFHSLAVSDYGLPIMSGFPKPIDHQNTFVLQGDGNPQMIGLAALDIYGVLRSGTISAGLIPDYVWDGTYMYLTND